MPLTEVTVTYQAGDDPQIDTVSTLIVNRDLATLFRAIEEKHVLLPWETSRALAPSLVTSLAHSDADDLPRSEAAPVAAQEPLV